MYTNDFNPLDRAKTAAQIMKGFVQDTQQIDLSKGGPGSGKKPFYKIGDKVKFPHPATGKTTHGSVSKVNSSDTGNHTYRITHGTSESGGIKETDMGFHGPE